MRVLLSTTCVTFIVLDSQSDSDGDADNCNCNSICELSAPSGYLDLSWWSGAWPCPSLSVCSWHGLRAENRPQLWPPKWPTAPFCKISRDQVHFILPEGVGTSSMTRTRPPLHSICRALYADRITALNVCCIPFHPVTLHHLKTDNLTILPASYETPSARWEMTDLKSSKRATL